MSDKERSEILQLLAKGKISADEAAELLAQVERDSAELAAASIAESNLQSDAPVIKVTDEIQSLKAEEAQAVGSNGDKPKWLRIRVREMGSERNKVTVNIPLWLVTMGLGVAGKVGADIEGFDANELRKMVQSGERGILVDVQDEEDGEHVQIFLD